MINIRIFHAVTALNEPLTVSVCPDLRKENLLFGDMTGYLPCSPGFHPVTVTGSVSRRVFLQKTMPFFTPEAFTLALISGAGGLEFLSVPDYPCFPVEAEFSCIRTVNLTDDPAIYHLYHYGGRPLFVDVWFRQITCHKPILSGKHGIYLRLPGQQVPLIPSTFEAQAGRAYTCYVYGSLGGATLSLWAKKDTPDSNQLSF